MKRVGGEVLKNYIPPSDTSLLNYLQKEMKKKQKGKKVWKKNVRRCSRRSK